MQNYNFNSVIKNGSGMLWQCGDNGAPERPDEYDPVELYYWTYRVSIIESVSITNNNTKPINVKLSLADADGNILGNISKNIEVNPGDTFVPVGESNKLFLKYGERIDVLYSNAVDDALVVSTISVMNMYEFGHIYPVEPPPTFYGDIGLMTAGESNANAVDRIDFSSDTIDIHYVYSIYNSQGKACGSNGPTAQVAGGYSSRNNIELLTFSTFAMDSGWGYLWDGTGRFTACSDAIICLYGGGYSSNDVQVKAFDTGGTGTRWGGLYQNGSKERLTSLNNTEVALFMSGYYYSNQITEAFFASESDCAYWGTFAKGYAYQAYGNSNDTEGIIVGDGYNGYKDNQRMTFATKANCELWGVTGLYTYMYETGGTGNDVKGLYGGGENFGSALYEIYFATEANFTFWGNCTYFDGGQPQGCSGN